VTETSVALPDRRVVVTALGVTQILAWGSTFYLLAVLAPYIARDTGWAYDRVIAGVSVGLLAAGIVSPRVGRFITAHGGRPVLAIGALLLAAGLAALGLAPNFPFYLAAWAIVGLGMGAGLYDAAFSTLGNIYGSNARGTITSVTLFGGFASTLSWPLTAWLDTSYGWRGTYLAYGIVQLAVCLPLHLCLGGAAAAPPAPAGAPRGHTLAEAVRHPAFWTLALAFAVDAFVFSAMAVHLIPLFERLGRAGGPAPLLSVLLAMSLASLAFYLRAVAPDKTFDKRPA